MFWADCPVPAAFDGGEDAGDAVAGCGDVFEGLGEPVLAEGVVVGVGEVAGGGIGQPVQRDVWAGTETAGVHGSVDQGPGGAPGYVVALEQDGHPGQVLGDLGTVCTLGGLGKPCIITGDVGEAGQVFGSESVRHVDLVPVQQFPGVSVPVQVGSGGKDVPVLGPQGGQHQHRGARRVVQQAA
ncbi:hypothetical protein OG788_46135 [Streptomyces sp. NBC_00647]|uniref:hypothetical protein n=1 Tax=Streptomyces sp. NBC_00647 TaxID=2975796 RepID=UPI003244EE59